MAGHSMLIQGGKTPRQNRSQCIPNQ